MSCLKNKSHPNVLLRCRCLCSILRHVRILDKPEQGRMATPYIAIAMGSPWVVHSLDCSFFLPATFKSDGVEWVLSIKTQGGANSIDIFNCQVTVEGVFWVYWVNSFVFKFFHFASAESELCVLSHTFGLGKVVRWHPRSLVCFLNA